MELKIDINRFEKLMFTLLIVYVNFIQYKIYQNSLIMLGIGIIIIGITLLKARRKASFKIEKPISTLLLFLMYMAIPSLLFGGGDGFNQYITVAEYTIILVCLVKLCTDINDVEWLIKVKVICTIVICISFILQPAVYHDKVNTIQYTLVQRLNPNTFSLDILVGLWSLLYLNVKKKLNIIVTSILSLFFLYCIFLTAARKSLLCGVLVLALWVIWIYIPGRGGKINRSILARVFVISVLVLIVAYYTMKNLMDSQMFNRFQSLLSGGDGSANNRLNMYFEGFKVFLKNPILGYGFGGYQSIYGGYSHATLVEIPVSGGIVGTVLYCLYFMQMINGTLMVKRIKAKNGEDNSLDTMSLILSIVMVVLCVCVIHPYLFNSYIAMAIVISSNIISKRERSKL